MTKSNGMPKYSIDAGQLALTMAPPFSFPGVTMRVFPLRANMYRLTDFCNRYLNIGPPEVGVFRPSVPYVVFSMINYGKLASAITNLGWVAQNEVVFTVLLEWYKKDPKTGQLVFHDWASCTPFVFVDSMTSLTTGREVYGWPKVAISLNAEVDAWTASPRKRRRVMTLNSMLFEKAFAGQRQEEQTLIAIDKEASPSMSQFPPQWDTALNPLHAVSRAARGSMAMAGSAMSMIMRSPMQGYGKLPDMASQIEMLKRLMVYANPMRVWPGGKKPPTPTSAALEAGNLYNKTINLKQFRDAANPNEVAYQSLNVSEMRPQTVNAGGLLGDLSLLRGDPSGGFRVRMHRYDQQPIIDCLGLEVESEREDGGVKIATLSPTMPYWVEQDMTYGLGETLAWRTRRSGWHFKDKDNNEIVGAGPKDGAPGNPLNTTRSGAVQEVSGPFEYPNTTARVLPLMADHDVLNDFCRKYFMAGKDDLGPDADNMSFEAYGSYVYMTIFNFEEQASASMNIGRISDKKVAFFVPMKIYKDRKRKKDGSIDPQSGTLLSLGMVSPFTYANSNIAAISGREICGFTTVQADIQTPRGGWLDQSGPAKPVHGLMSIATDLMQAVNIGQEVKREELLRVVTGCPLPETADEKWREVAATWGRELLADLKRKRKLPVDELQEARALTLEFMGTEEGNDCALNEFSLKQFRDSAEPEDACYQAIVQSRHVLDRLHDMREIEEPLYVAINRFPSQQIVKTLGLKVKFDDLRGSQPVDWIEVQRPFWARISLRSEVPQAIVQRAGKKPGWKLLALDPTADGAADKRRWFFKDDKKHDSKTRVGSGLCEWIDKQEVKLAQHIEGKVKAPDERAPGGSPSKPEQRGAKTTTALDRLQVSRGLPAPLDFWTDLSAHPSWVPGTILRRRHNLQEAKQQWIEGALARWMAERHPDPVDPVDKPGDTAAQKKNKAAERADNTLKRAENHKAMKTAQESEPWLLSREKAAVAIDKIAEPQAVIESMLSAEWGDRGEPRWLKRYGQILENYRYAHQLGNQLENGKLSAKDRASLKEALLSNEEIDVVEQQLQAVTQQPLALQLKRLKTLAAGQKPYFYIRSDSLGPLTDAFARQHKLRRQSDDIYLVELKDRETVIHEAVLSLFGGSMEGFMASIEERIVASLEHMLEDDGPGMSVEEGPIDVDDGHGDGGMTTAPL